MDGYGSGIAAHARAGSWLVAEVKREVEDAASRAAIDTPRRSRERSIRDALYIFREIFGICGDSTRALDAAVHWPLAHPEIYRLGPADYIEGWVLCQEPDIWDGLPKAPPPPT